MDFLLDALGEIAAEVFAAVAHLLNLDLDIVFVDTTSSYFEAEATDMLADLQDDADEDEQINRPSPAPAPSVTSRTTATICRRWCSRWR
jgi:hypothetical protein